MTLWSAAAMNGTYETGSYYRAEAPTRRWFQIQNLGFRREFGLKST